MNEAEWLACTDPGPMLEFLRGKASGRKLRLSAVACCRRIWTVVDSDYHRLAEITERYADGQATQEELHAALDEAHDPDWTAGLAFEEAASLDDMGNAAGDAAGNAAYAAAELPTGYPVDRENNSAWRAARQAELVKQAVVLRHIMGNPFRPSPMTDQYSFTVVHLAQALYDSKECSFALHDALLDAGHAELSEHFREQEHPNGCAVIDLILGKT